MVRLLTIVSLSLVIASCGRQQGEDKGRIDNVCDKFMQAFSKGRYKEAIDLLRHNSVLEPEKIDTLQATIERQSINAFPAYGKMVSSEFIVERKVKDFITKRFYVLKCEKYPVKFDFTLYKGSNGWTITSFSYNDELIELLY
jgi:hypothetical protein